MLSGSGKQVYLACGYTDMRKSINGLMSIVEGSFELDPFGEVLKVLPEAARENSLTLAGKRYCDRLFEHERQFADLSPKKRREERMKTPKPEMEAFFAWADSCNAIPKSPVGKAVYYAQSQRKYLERYLLDGRLEISNNRAERSIKPFVIGRKNFLFANTPRGAKASAVLYSLVETAKECGIAPYVYLTRVFRLAPNRNLALTRNL